MGLSIIHLSDIHFTENNNIILDRIESFNKACVSVLPHNSDIVLVISGDIANTGSEKEYEVARSFIDKVSCYIAKQKNSKVQYVFVPGNHDCNLSKKDSLREHLIKTMKPSVVEVEYFNQVNKVQSFYCDFTKGYDVPSGSLILTKEIIIQDKKILFLLFNTAWMSMLDETPGKLIMPIQLYNNRNLKLKDYSIVFSVLHHPFNWLNPDFKDDFTKFVRSSTDVLLVGHEHTKDDYLMSGENWNFMINCGKELQTTSSEASAFSIFVFEESMNEYMLYDYKWSEDENIFIRLNAKHLPFHKNPSIFGQEFPFTPNKKTIKNVNDFGIVVNHFSKENIVLSDLYVEHEFKKINLTNGTSMPDRIQEKAVNLIQKCKMCVFTGSAVIGKTALAKMIYQYYINKELCCLLVNGKRFNSPKFDKIIQIIERSFNEQYDIKYIENFRQLPKQNKVLIVDDFDQTSLYGKSQKQLIEFLSQYFDKVIIFSSSTIEMDMLSWLSSQCFRLEDELIAYEILPLGNRKRKELIRKWYCLKDIIPETEDLDKQIDYSVNLINSFLGNGAKIIPAMPVFIISVLQNNTSYMNPSLNGTQYGFLYESLIQRSLATVSSDYLQSGSYNIDVSIISHLAFYMLCQKQTCFFLHELADIGDSFATKMKVDISKDALLNKMISAKILCEDPDTSGLYKFKYPYIFYYFVGRHIAYNLDDKLVKSAIDHMSSRLYNEDYGNIMVFVCHFANHKDIIESILLNAYSLFDEYNEFDFQSSTYLLEDINKVIDIISPKDVGSNEDVQSNQEQKLLDLDEAEINDGNVNDSNDEINDDIDEKEKDLALISAAFKTLEVLGQILQNYPGTIDGDLKLCIIKEICHLGMRSIQAIITTIEHMEKDFISNILEKLAEKKSNLSKTDIELLVRQLLSLIVSNMVQSVINVIANSLNSKYLLKATVDALVEDKTIAANLILIDLKMNYLKICDLKSLEILHNQLETLNNQFALYILKSIAANYLNYNKCKYQTRAKICALFNFSEKHSLIKNQKHLIED